MERGTGRRGSCALCPFVILWAVKIGCEGGRKEGGLAGMELGKMNGLPPIPHHSCNSPLLPHHEPIDRLPPWRRVGDIPSPGVLFRAGEGGFGYDPPPLSTTLLTVQGGMGVVVGKRHPFCIFSTPLALDPWITGCDFAEFFVARLRSVFHESLAQAADPVKTQRLRRMSQI